MMPIVRFLVVIFLFYIGGYIAFRQTHIEVWQRDNRPYVIFPERYGVAVYYTWRPLSYIDGAITGMQFHIGPHR